MPEPLEVRLVEPTKPKPDRSKGGRIPIVSDPRMRAVLTALGAGNYRRHAARFGGVSHETFYRWLHDADLMIDGVTFADAVQKAESDAVVRALARIAQAGAKGSWQADAWFLERRYPADFGLRHRVDLSVEVRREIERLTSDPLEVEEAVAEAEALLAARRASIDDE